MKMFVKKTKTEFVINILFFKIKYKSEKIIEEKSVKQAKIKIGFKLICSLVWKFLKLVITKMIATIISAIVNGLFYQHLILYKNEFFYREVKVMW